MFKALRKIFTKEVDRQEAAILDKAVTPSLRSAGQTADSLHRLLKKNGITLQIYVATGGDKHGH